MGEILSHSEVEAILSALDLSSTEISPQTIIAQESVENVERYDFEHPVPLGSSQLDALRLASASASPSLETGLTGLLRTPVAVNFLDVEQSTFRDYLATAENPTCLAVFKSNESDGLWLLDMSRSLAFAIVDCLLGGGPSASGPTLMRPFTDVEVRLIAKALSTILRELAGDLLQTQTLQLTQLISDGSLISEKTSNEAVALVSFEIVCGPCQGLIQLCVPWKEVVPVSSVAKSSGRVPLERMRFAAGKVPVIATARIARLNLSTRDLANLSPGDVLLTDTASSAEISLEVDGREIFRGTAGQSRDRKVFLVSSPVTSARTDETDAE